MKTLTPQQHDAAYTTGLDLCVDAGAGSGKTTVLVERIMHLLNQGVGLRRIVAITFTRKAAGEMKERLREAIHRRPENDPKSMDKWRSLELEIDSARISTIDGFCAALLHEYALRAGLDPNFTTLGDEEAPLLREDVVTTTLASLLDRGEGPAYRLVVEHGLERMAECLRESLNQPARIDDAAQAYAGLDADGLAARWREHAAKLQRDRYTQLAAEPELQTAIGALSDLAGQCSQADDKREVARSDALRYLSMLRDPENTERMREGLAGIQSLNLQGGRHTQWTSKKAFQAVKTAVDSARALADAYAEPEYDPEVERAAAQLSLDFLTVLIETAAAYRAAKRARTALDFSDLLVFTVQLLQNRPDVRAQIIDSIEHLLIDEFQDTNAPQLALAQLLTGDNAAELFVVGDAKQSVYRFRGAEVEVFAAVKKRTQKTLPLNENFRSVPPVIAFINHFFETNKLLARVEPEFRRLIAKRDATDGPCVEFLVPEAIENNDAESDDEPANGGRMAEAELVAARIAQLCGPSGARVYDTDRKEWRPARFGDVAILYHASTHAGEYEAALRRRGIPATVIAGSGFYARQEIIDLQNMFSVALDPWDEPALAAFLRSPLAGVNDDTLFRLTRDSGLARAFWNGTATRNEEENAILDHARELIRFVQERREWPVAALMRELLGKTGLEAVLLTLYHGEQKAGNIHKLIELARRFGGAGRHGLHAFTQHLASLTRSGLRDGDAELLASKDGAVTLMTVHKAKGLEFPIVAVVEAGRPARSNKDAPCIVNPQHGAVMAVHNARGKSVWPVYGEHLHRLDKEHDTAEDARVLYVAMTRARDRLLIAGPAKPQKNTWMASINDTLAIADRPHGDTLAGTGWEASLLRKADETPLRTAAAEQGASWSSVEQLQAQAAPLVAAPAPGQVIPVRALLDRMHPPSEDHTGAGSGQQGLDRRTLGSAAHALLERWDFRKPASTVEIAHEFFVTPAHSEACAKKLDAIADRLQRSTLWPRLVYARSLHRELPFLFTTGGIVLNGVVDALIDESVLIDYKLGAPTPERLFRYQTQLQIYAAAIRAATGRAPSEAWLYYLDSGELAAVEVSVAALDNVIARAASVLQVRQPIQV